MQVNSPTVKPGKRTRSRKKKNQALLPEGLEEVEKLHEAELAAVGDGAGLETAEPPTTLVQVEMVAAGAVLAAAGRRPLGDENNNLILYDLSKFGIWRWMIDTECLDRNLFSSIRFERFFCLSDCARKISRAGKLLSLNQ